ncbi:MAG: hypothetical protein ACRDN0_22275 [Trebonia sp.]
MQQALLDLVRPQAIVGTLRIMLRFARSPGTDPELIGAHAANLLLHGFATPADGAGTKSSASLSPPIHALELYSI